MNHYLYCNRNYILRKILNTQNNVDIIKDLIESILDFKIEEISINPYVVENERYLPKEENFGVVDVRVKTNNGQDYNIGIQFLDGEYIQNKIALYYLYIHLNQICYEDKRKIVKTITINFLDFPYHNSKYHEVVILNKSNKFKFKEEEAETHIIELPKFKVSDPNKITRLEQWIGYIQGEDQELVNMSINNNKYIEKLNNMVQDYWKHEKI